MVRSNVSTIGKPHYFDLRAPTGNGEKQIGRAYGAPCQPSTRWSLTRSLLGRTVPPLMPRVPTIMVMKEPHRRAFYWPGRKHRH